MTAPVILAIDTATELCSVAVLHARLDERCEAVGQKHSERVLPLVDLVLREAGLRLRDVDAFAFGAGPGSFTGLRIACGVVQGLAYACRRPVVAVGNLRALAAAAFARCPAAATALSAIVSGPAFPSAISRATFRHTVAIWRSRLRTPASRV